MVCGGVCVHVQRINDTLASLGLLEKTLILFTGQLQPSLGVDLCV